MHGQSPQLRAAPPQGPDPPTAHPAETLQFGVSGSCSQRAWQRKGCSESVGRAAKSTEVWDRARCVPGYLPVAPKGQEVDRALPAQDGPWAAPGQHLRAPGSLQPNPAPGLNLSN